MIYSTFVCFNLRREPSVCRIAIHKWLQGFWMMHKILSWGHFGPNFLKVEPSVSNCEFCYLGSSQVGIWWYRIFAWSVCRLLNLQNLNFVTQRNTVCEVSTWPINLCQKHNFWACFRFIYVYVQLPNDLLFKNHVNSEKF